MSILRYRLIPMVSEANADTEPTKVEEEIVNDDSKKQKQQSTSSEVDNKETEMKTPNCILFRSSI